jgi:hypothetical protein
MMIRFLLSLVNIIIKFGLPWQKRIFVCFYVISPWKFMADEVTQAPLR